MDEAHVDCVHFHTLGRALILAECFRCLLRKINTQINTWSMRTADMHEWVLFDPQFTQEWLLKNLDLEGLENYLWPCLDFLNKEIKPIVKLW